MGFQYTVDIYNLDTGLRRNKSVTPEWNGGAIQSSNTQVISAGVHEKLNLNPDLQVPGLTYFFYKAETDEELADNYIEVGLDVGGTFYPMLKVMQNEPQGLRLSSGMVDEYGVCHLYARASDTAAVLEHTIWED